MKLFEGRGSGLDVLGLMAQEGRPLTPRSVSSLSQGKPPRTSSDGQVVAIRWGNLETTSGPCGTNEDEAKPF